MYVCCVHEGAELSDPGIPSHPIFPCHPRRNWACAHPGKEAAFPSPLGNEGGMERWGTSTSCGGGKTTTRASQGREGGREKSSRDGVVHRMESMGLALQAKDEPASNHFVLRGG